MLSAASTRPVFLRPEHFVSAFVSSDSMSLFYAVTFASIVHLLGFDINNAQQFSGMEKIFKRLFEDTNSAKKLTVDAMKSVGSLLKKHHAGVNFSALAGEKNSILHAWVENLKHRLFQYMMDQSEKLITHMDLEELPGWQNKSAKDIREQSKEAAFANKWGDYIHVFALSHMLKTPIILHRAHPQDPKLPPEECLCGEEYASAQVPLHLLLTKDHYEFYMDPKHISALPPTPISVSHEGLEEKSVENEGQSQRNPRALNKDLRTLIIEAFRATEDGTGKNIVLFLGPTGAGKSTLINYLLYRPMIKHINLKTKRASVVVKKGYENGCAKIGMDRTNSATLYPEIFWSQKDNIYYCDCAGFGDSGGDQYQVCASIATKKVVHSARSVRTIVLVIDWSTIDAGRADGFINALQTLRDFLSNNEAGVVDSKIFQESIIFVFTKTPADLSLDNILATLQEIKEEKEQNIRRNENAAIVFMCDLMLSRPGNVINANPLDEGQTRLDILKCISKSRALSPKFFGFPAAANTKKVLKDLMEQISVTGRQIIQDLEQRPTEIEHKTKQKIMEQSTIRDLDLKLLEIDRKKEQVVTGWDNIDQLITENSARIAKWKSEKAEAETKRDQFAEKIKELNQTTPIKYFVYNGIPFEKVEYRCEGMGSEFLEEDSKPAAGAYSVKFITGPDYYGKGWVTLNVQKKNIPANKDERKLNENKMQTKEDEIKQLQSNIREAEQHAQQLSLQKLNLQKDAMKLLDEKRKIFVTLYQHDRVEAKKRLEKLESDIDVAVKVLAEAKKEFLQQRDSYDLVKKIVPIFDGSNSPVIKEFLSLYDKYMQNHYNSLASNIFALANQPPSYQESLSTSTSTTTTATMAQYQP
jgi:hypothetical protein